MTFADSKDVGEWAVAAKANEFLGGTFKDQWEELKKDIFASLVPHNIPFVSALSSKPQTWVIDKLLPWGCYLLITGKFGGTKSLTALLLAHGIETGGTILGRKVTGKTPVLYIDRENPQETIGVRRANLGIPDNQIRYWGDWTDGKETPNLDDPRLAEFAIKEKGILIFDSLTDWLEGESENDPSKMTEVSRKFRHWHDWARASSCCTTTTRTARDMKLTAIPAGSDMAVKIAKNERTEVIEIRTERFRMCAPWEMDIAYNFKSSPWTCTVLKDNAQDGYKIEAVANIKTVAGILASYHQTNDGAPMKKTHLVDVLQAQGISKEKAVLILTTGAKDGVWTFDPGKQNAVMYSLVGWKPEPSLYFFIRQSARNQGGEPEKPSKTEAEIEPKRTSRFGRETSVSSGGFILAGNGGLSGGSKVLVR